MIVIPVYLNTSNVKVQPANSLTSQIASSNLNTSNVKVQRKSHNPLFLFTQI